jgi:hypothetical protein
MGIHRPKTIGDESNDNSLPAWSTVFGGFPPKLRSACQLVLRYFWKLEEVAYALVLQISLILSMTLCNVLAYKCLFSLSIDQLVCSTAGEKQLTTGNSDEKLCISIILVLPQSPAIGNGEIIRIASSSGISHMSKLSTLA